MVAVSLGPSTVLARDPRSIRLEVCTEIGSRATGGGGWTHRANFWVDSSLNCSLKPKGRVTVVVLCALGGSKLKKVCTWLYTSFNQCDMWVCVRSDRGNVCFWGNTRVFGTFVLNMPVWKWWNTSGVRRSSWFELHWGHSLSPVAVLLSLAWPA